ncbi:TRAP transporter small permease [Halomonas kalidii]|uniref:TRAP transporter small permease protein n=1 Tax=Halomonas kalidii TaxID=3043293 RepID=A0ABT6VP50_9GAMM|nr:TRAP transporter small permease [Halomonas kalidii]MDI5935775.1 TRAP transporter small permease [Halomonas kalidii]
MKEWEDDSLFPLFHVAAGVMTIMIDKPVLPAVPSACRDPLEKSTLKHRVFKFAMGVTQATEAISAILLVAIILMNVAQVFFRYVLVDPLSWSEETMRYSTTWMVMLAGSAALFRGEHMVISLFTSVRSPFFRRLIHLSVLTCIAGFCLLLMWEGFPAAINNMRQMSPATRIPMTLPYMAIPVGASLMLLKVLCLMVLPEDVLRREEAEENQP